MGTLRTNALGRGLEVVDFPLAGQQTNDYQAFLTAVATSHVDAMAYVGVGICEPCKAVGKVVGKHGLLK